MTWAIVAIQAITILAIWVALKRVRFWKEQVLHSISVVESNRHQAQVVTRAEIAAAREAAAQVIPPDMGPIHEELRLIREQVDLRSLVKGHAEGRVLEEKPGPNQGFPQFVQFLRSLDQPSTAAREYLETHMQRTARTLALAPPPFETRRALELGSYMFMTPALGCVLGYAEVRGAYMGPLGRSVKCSATSQGKKIFECEVDQFNAEKDRYPYPDGHFDLVMACEIIEHMTLDPMFLLLECARVLCEGGALVVTTPNVASATSVARTLTATQNPQIYSLYPWADTESPHVREYTPGELHDAVVAAGLEVEYLFTETISGYDSKVWVSELLQRLGLPGGLRGEQMYCVARKRDGAPAERYPKFLYQGQPDLT